MYNIYDITRRLADEMKEGAICAALAFGAIHGLESDDISENAAFKKYGKSWVVDRTRRSLLHFSRVGKSGKSTKNYSVFEIETLKRAEKNIEEAYNIAVKSA